MNARSRLACFLLLRCVGINALPVLRSHTIQELQPDATWAPLTGTVLLHRNDPETKSLGKKTTLLPNGKHQVEHMPILKNTRFWVLMGAIILIIAGVVVKVEVTDNRRKGFHDQEDPDTGREEESDSAEELENGFSKSGVHLAFTVIALYMAMLLWGVAQEYVMTQEYENEDGTLEKTPSALTIVLWNRLVASLFFGIILKASGRELLYDGFSMGVLPACSNSVAAWCQYKSLAYVTYALQVTMKSTKLVPVVLLSSLRGKKHTVFDYMEVSVLTMALVVFGVETETGGGQLGHAKAIGVLLLIGLVLFDSLTPHFQDLIFKSYPEADALVAQFSMSVSAFAGIFVLQILTGTLFQFSSFVARHPESLLHLSVLALSSTMTQYLITFTIKHYGPVSFTVISSVRVVVAVIVSSILFRHHLSLLACFAMVIVFTTILSRAFRQYSMVKHPGTSGDMTGLDHEAGDPNRSFWSLFEMNAIFHRTKGYSSLAVCAAAIHLCFWFYAVAQEFISVHSFDSQIFNFPIFIVAVNHTTACLFATFALKAQSVPLLTSDLRFTAVPALTNYVATALQHAAVYEILFPVQTLMKSLKILPVMAVGRFLRNRYYTCLDYIEAIIITGLVAFFVFDFEYLTKENQTTQSPSYDRHVILGVLMMLGYLLMDSCTVNVEDLIYQVSKIDPGQMLFGMELISGSIAWGFILVTGQASQAFVFLVRYGDSLLYISLAGMALSSAVGSYTCMLTVRLYGPVVFSLIMLCRQISSLVFSVVLFQHAVNWQSCLCLVIVCNVVLLASVRRVTTQMNTERDEHQERLQKDAVPTLPHNSTPHQESSFVAGAAQQVEQTGSEKKSCRTS